MMTALRYILVLCITVTFAGRAAAQWALFDLDAALTQTNLSQNIENASSDGMDSGCCCEDEQGEDGDCCGDSCAHFSCPMLMEPVDPETGSVPAYLNDQGLPLLFQASLLRADGWLGGLERPPRLV
ncbi:MAG: hypothetical protein RIQ81_1453 [Pseudomonadota bacterium]|jgi:hypothetical protein